MCMLALVLRQVTAQDAGLVTAATPSPDSSLTLVACTAAVLLYTSQSLRLSDWSRQHGATVAARLPALGQVHSITFQPQSKVRSSELDWQTSRLPG